MGNITTKIIGIVSAVFIIAFLVMFILGEDSDDNNKVIVVGVESGNVVSEGTAHILKQLMEEYYDVDIKIEKQAGLGAKRITQEQIFKKMDVDLIHINPMISVEDNKDLVALYVDNNHTVVASTHSVRSSKNLCVTKKVASEYDIEWITDLARRKVGAAFVVNVNEDVENDDGEVVDKRAEILVKGEDRNNIFIEQIRAKSYDMIIIFK